MGLRRSFRLLTGETEFIQITGPLAIIAYPTTAYVARHQPGLYFLADFFPPGNYHSVSRARESVLPPLQYGTFYFNILYWLVFWRHHGNKRRKAFILIASAVLSLLLGVWEWLLIRRLRKLPFPFEDKEAERDYKGRQLGVSQQVMVSKMVIAAIVFTVELAAVIYARWIPSSVRRYPKRFEPTASRRHTKPNRSRRELLLEDLNTGELHQIFETQRSLKNITIQSHKGASSESLKNTSRNKPSIRGAAHHSLIEPRVRYWSQYPRADVWACLLLIGLSFLFSVAGAIWNVFIFRRIHMSFRWFHQLHHASIMLQLVCGMMFIFYQFSKLPFDARIFGAFRVDLTLLTVSMIAWVVCLGSYIPALNGMLDRDRCGLGDYFCSGAFVFSLTGIFMYVLPVVVFILRSTLESWASRTRKKLGNLSS